MSAVRDRLLAKIKSRTETFLGENTCTISRQKRKTDLSGSPTGAAEVIASGVPCRIIDAESETEEIGKQHSITEEYMLIVPVGTDLGVGYTVTVDDGNVYQILEIMTRLSEAVDAQARITRERR